MMETYICRGMCVAYFSCSVVLLFVMAYPLQSIQPWMYCNAPVDNIIYFDDDCDVCLYPSHIKLYANDIIINCSIVVMVHL